MASLIKKVPSDVAVETESGGIREGVIITPFKEYPDGKRFYGKPYESYKGKSMSNSKRVGKRVGGKIETKKSGEIEL